MRYVEQGEPVLSDLSRSLIDAAAVAIVTSIGYEGEGKAVVAAVLETLAAKAHSYNETLRLHKHQRNSLSQMASKVKKSDR